MSQQRFRLKPGHRKQQNQSKSGRSTALIQGTSQAQFNDGNFTVVGGDNLTHVHNHGAIVSLESVLRAIPNFRKIHQDMLAKATPGTGMWLLKGKVFSIWLEPNGDLKILWGSGIPGAGKTVLAALVIDTLEAVARESGHRICVAYIYIRYSDRAEMTVRSVLEVLAKQIVERYPDALPIVCAVYAQHVADGTQPSESQLLGLLQKLTDYVTTTFVLDALDEAPIDIQLNLVRTLASLNCKMFITSRPLTVVEEQFPSAHRFSIVARDGDIDLLIQKKLEGSASLQGLLGKAGSSLRDEIVGTIKRKCGGMFLHASLQLDALCHCLSIHDVQETLEQFPSEIEDAYAQTWSRILDQHPRHVSFAKTVLLWVTHAQRSMKIEELQRAVATSPDSHKFEPARMVPEAMLLSICRGLVIFEEETRLVRLVHYTAKNPVEDLLLEFIPNPNSLIAAVCMTHLTDIGFQNTSIDSAQAQTQALDKDPLLAYAHGAWAFHAQSSLGDEAIASPLTKFVADCHAFPVLISGNFDLLSPLHLLIFYKLPLSFAGPLNDGALNMIVTKIYGYTPMGMACLQGYWVGVQALLLHSGDSINEQDKTGFSPLMYAVWYGHEGVAELLLAHPDVSVNLVNEYGNSALMLAAYIGYRNIVKLLLAHPEIQVNLVMPTGTSALIAAAFNGDPGTFELLLAHPEIQVNHQTVSGFSALAAAADRGYDRIVELLLARPEIEVNIRDQYGRSPLWSAAHNGYHRTVKLLLSHPEIAVNTADAHGSTPLLLASQYGHAEVVEFLLPASDFDPNHRDGDGDTAVKMAARYGHEGVVRMLLEVPGIDIAIASTSDGHTAMSAALANGHDVIVRLLRDFEARANPPIDATTPNDEQLSQETGEGWMKGFDSDDSELFEDALDTF